MAVAVVGKCSSVLININNHLVRILNVTLIFLVGFTIQLDEFSKQKYKKYSKIHKKNV